MSIEKFKSYVPLNKCIHNCLYLIMARNSTLGIFNKFDNSFILSRFKGYGKNQINYLFPEYHWDSDEKEEIDLLVKGVHRKIEINHGTVKPIKSIEMTSYIDDKGKIKDDEKVLLYLNEKAKRIEDYL